MDSYLHTHTHTEESISNTSNINYFDYYSKWNSSARWHHCGSGATSAAAAAAAAAAAMAAFRRFDQIHFLVLDAIISIDSIILMKRGCDWAAGAPVRKMSR